MMIITMTELVYVLILINKYIIFCDQRSCALGQGGGGACTLAKRTRLLVRKNIVLINRYAHVKLILSWSLSHVARMTCLVTKYAWHAYGVIGVYKIHHGACRISYFAEPTILSLAGTVMGEVGVRNI